MFERFTEGARRAVVQAQPEAGALGHDYIGTEHLLIGLSAEGAGIAAVVLAELGVSAGAVRSEVARVVGRGRNSGGEHRRPFTPRAKKVLELALREALQLGDNFIGTEHLLLGVVREGEGVGIQVLTALGAPQDQIRAAVLRHRELEPPPPVRAGGPTEGNRLDVIVATLDQILQQQEEILGLIRRLEARPPPSTEQE